MSDALQRFPVLYFASELTLKNLVVIGREAFSGE